MAVSAKICGLTDPAAVEAAVKGGARYAGFVFFARSPRNLRPADAGALIGALPPSVEAVGVMVDPSDADIDGIVSKARVKILQLHGGEMPDRVAAIKRRTGLKLIKAIRVGAPEDVAAARAFEGVADMLLFDTKPKGTDQDGLPGGTGKSFDWSLLAGHSFKKPWMLSGGLHAGNVADAVAISGARIVDVSSGVEIAPGKKSPRRIAEFLDAVRRL